MTGRFGGGSGLRRDDDGDPGQREQHPEDDWAGALAEQQPGEGDDKDGRDGGQECAVVGAGDCAEELGEDAARDKDAADEGAETVARGRRGVRRSRVAVGARESQRCASAKVAPPTMTRSAPRVTDGIAPKLARLTTYIPPQRHGASRGSSPARRRDMALTQLRAGGGTQPRFDGADEFAGQFVLRQRASTRRRAGRCGD